MPEPTQHSAHVEVIRTAFERLGWNMTPVNTLLAFVNETNEERIPSYDQVEAAVHGLVEQLEMLRERLNEAEVLREEADLRFADAREQLETLRNFAESVCEIIERSRNPVEEITGRLDDVREIAYQGRTNA